MTKTSSKRIKGNAKDDKKFAKSLTTEVLALLGGLIFWWAGYNMLSLYHLETSEFVIYFFLILGIVMIISPTIISHVAKERKKKK